MSQTLRGGLMACLLALAAHANADTNSDTPSPSDMRALDGRALPQGWTALSLPVLPGSFQQQGNRDIALLMYNSHGGQHEYGLVVVPDASGGLPAKVVKTFTDTGPNAPRLSLIKPGNYVPVCHNGGHCAPVKISNEAIGLCFGEASCEIIYFNGGAYRELVVTD